MGSRTDELLGHIAATLDQGRNSAESRDQRYESRRRQAQVTSSMARAEERERHQEVLAALERLTQAVDHLTPDLWEAELARRRTELLDQWLLNLIRDVAGGLRDRSSQGA